MDFRIANFNSVNQVKLSQNKQSKGINFTSKPDIVDFSSKTKERSAIVKELSELGYCEEEINLMLQKCYNTDKYKEYVNGLIDEFDGVKYTAHWVEDLDRDLTPTEAILYQWYEMNDYYMQYGDTGCIPNGQQEGTFESQRHNIGEAKFLPTDLAKHMLNGMDIVLSGMILKGTIDETTAQEVAKYYLQSTDNYENNINVKSAEHAIKLITEELDLIKEWTSDEKDEFGNLKTGLTRPLTDEEAVCLVLDDYLPRDTERLNNYIEFNKELGTSLYGMDLNDLWEEDPHEIKSEREAKKAESIISFPKQPKAQNLQEQIQYLSECEKNTSIIGIYDYFSKLDSDKFFGKISSAAFRQDAFFLSLDRIDDKTLSANIEALNSISDELLQKISTNENGEKVFISVLHKILSQKDLPNRIQELEELRINSPRIFDSWSRSATLDFLANTTFYTDTQKTLDEFLSMLYGEELPQETQAIIHEFPKKDE